MRRRHAVPNALLPVMTVTILSLGYILGGAIVIETIFSWPGLGRLTYTAIGNQDYALLEGLFLVFSAAVIVVEPGRRPPLLLPRPAREGGLTMATRERTLPPSPTPPVPRAPVNPKKIARQRRKDSVTANLEAVPAERHGDGGSGHPVVLRRRSPIFAPLLADKCDLSPICHPNNPSLLSAEFAVLVRDGLPGALGALPDDLGREGFAHRRARGHAHHGRDRDGHRARRRLLRRLAGDRARCA